MRYIINTEDQEGIIGIQIKRWSDEKKLVILEKAEPLVEIKEHLEKVARALDILKKSGYNSEVLRVWLHEKTGLSKSKIDSLLSEQDRFFKAIGVLK